MKYKLSLLPKLKYTIENVLIKSKLSLVLNQSLIWCHLVRSSQKIKCLIIQVGLFEYVYARDVLGIGISFWECPFPKHLWYMCCERFILWIIVFSAWILKYLKFEMMKRFIIAFQSVRFQERWEHGVVPFPFRSKTEKTNRSFFQFLCPLPVWGGRGS